MKSLVPLSRKARVKVVLRRLLPIFGWSMLVLAAIVIGIVIAFSLRAVPTGKLARMLELIESGQAFKSESESFKAQADKATLSPTITITPGLYVYSNKGGDLVADTALRFNANGSYDYRLALGNGRVHKAYQVRGLWFVSGEVVHFTYVEGDAFLLSPQGRVSGGSERAIITRHDPAGGLLSMLMSDGNDIPYRQVAAEGAEKP